MKQLPRQVSARVPHSPWKVNKLIEEHDHKTIRCPRVGGQVNFKFCRFENNMLPCRWIVGCWQGQMDINKLLEDHYSKKELDQIFALPKPKLQSLVDLMEKAKKVKGAKI
jgi:hypothetical protein